MASPKFDAISVQFSKKIADTVATAATAGTILTVAERETYINLALNEVFRKYWAGVQGDSKKFLEIFPELLRSFQITTISTGTFNLALPLVPLTGTIDPTASTSVTGVNTLFLTELEVGDRILVTGLTRIVATIVSNTSLTVTQAFTDVANDTSPEKYASVYDFFKMIDAYTVTSPKYIKFLDKTLRTVVITGTNNLYTPSATHLIGFELEGTLEFYPAASFNAQKVKINYIRKPVNPTTGEAFVNGDTRDIPFNAIWSEEIAETAFRIWQQNTQERNMVRSEV